ncbi:hypothetical protein DsansV1_C11g0113981 [Dioscorea sansibarensis]
MVWPGSLVELAEINKIKKQKSKTMHTHAAEKVLHELGMKWKLKLEKSRIVLQCGMQLINERW